MTLLARAEQMDNTLQSEICARIRQARVEVGLTLEEMADALDMTLRGYWNYEHNRVPFRNMGDISRITGVSQEWLWRGETGIPSEHVALLLDRLEEHEAQAERSRSAAVAGLASIDIRLSRIEVALGIPGEQAREDHS